MASQSEYVIDIIGGTMTPVIEGVLKDLKSDQTRKHSKIKSVKVQALHESSGAVLDDVFMGLVDAKDVIGEILFKNCSFTDEQATIISGLACYRVLFKDCSVSGSAWSNMVPLLNAAKFLFFDHSCDLEDEVTLKTMCLILHSAVLRQFNLYAQGPQDAITKLEDAYIRRNTPLDYFRLITPLAVRTKTKVELDIAQQELAKRIAAANTAFEPKLPKAVRKKVGSYLLKM